MLLEGRTGVTLAGDSDWEGAQQVFGVLNNVLFLDLRIGSQEVDSVWKNLLSCPLNDMALFCLCVIL